MGSAQVWNGGYLTQSRHRRLGESLKADVPTADGGQKRPIGNLSIGLKIAQQGADNQLVPSEGDNEWQ